jgi:hypothetical protein
MPATLPGKHFPAFSADSLQKVPHPDMRLGKPDGAYLRSLAPPARKYLSSCNGDCLTWREFPEFDGDGHIHQRVGLVNDDHGQPVAQSSTRRCHFSRPAAQQCPNRVNRVGWI